MLLARPAKQTCALTAALPRAIRPRNLASSIAPLSPTEIRSPYGDGGITMTQTLPIGALVPEIGFKSFLDVRALFLRHYIVRHRKSKIANAVKRKSKPVDVPV